MELVCIPFIKPFPWLKMYVGTGVYVYVCWHILIYMTFVLSGRLLGKLCGPTATSPMPDRAWLCAVDELPTSLDRFFFFLARGQLYHEKEKENRGRKPSKEKHRRP